MFSVSDESERRRKEAGERARRESRDKEKRQREEKSGDEIEIKIYAGKEPKNEGTKERTEERNGEIGTGGGGGRRTQDAFTIAPAPQQAWVIKVLQMGFQDI